MSQRTITCPSCGGDVPVTTTAARVAGCPYCESTLIVNEQAIRALGKMALLAEVPSCLAVGWRARCLEREIQVLGRIQYRYASGLWDEWWVQFLDDQSHAWISQDEDHYMLERPLPKLKAPDYASISPGDKFEIAGHKLWVEEKDQATMVGVQGELPLDAAPHATMRYIDLTDNRLKLTIEYFDDGTQLGFQGKYLRRQDLQKLDADEAEGGTWGSPYSAPALVSPPGKKQAISTGKPGAETGKPEVVTSSAGLRPRSVTCPGCGGTLELRDSEGTAMVACQFCDAAIDVSVPGAAQLLYQSEQRKQPFPIPLGARGWLAGAQWTVVGRVRYREDDPTGVWVWDELQLHSPERGYRFLGLEDGHWMLFERLKHPITFDPRHATMGQRFSVQGQKYKVYERSRAVIEYVEGELSWVARSGDKLGYMDAIRPPWMIGAEWTDNEMEWSLGRYLPVQEVADAFKIDVQKLPRPEGVAPAQPFKRTAGQRTRAWAGVIVGGVLLILALMALVTGGGEKIFEHPRVESSQYLSDAGFVSQPFEVPGGSHICKLAIEGHGLNNSWVGLSVAFLDEAENVVLDADAQVERYHGVEGGESWSEGSRSDYALFRLKGPATYRLNIFGEAGVWSRVGGDRRTTRGAPLSVALYRDVLPARYFVYAGILALVYPVWEFGRGAMFEARRWPSDD